MAWLKQRRSWFSLKLGKQNRCRVKSLSRSSLTGRVMGNAWAACHRSNASNGSRTLSLPALKPPGARLSLVPGKVLRQSRWTTIGSTRSLQAHRGLPLRSDARTTHGCSARSKTPGTRQAAVTAEHDLRFVWNSIGVQPKYKNDNSGSRRISMGTVGDLANPGGAGGPGAVTWAFGTAAAAYARKLAD
jgi:hypothetical protein